jgi:hypothetical protein
MTLWTGACGGGPGRQRNIGGLQRLSEVASALWQSETPLLLSMTLSAPPLSVAPSPAISRPRASLSYSVLPITL